MTNRRGRGLDRGGGPITGYRYDPTCKNNPRGC